MRATLRGLLDPAVNPQGTLHGATILVVGGGAGADLPHWRALRGARLVVWEPQPNFADALRRNLNTHEGESVVIAAVAPVAGEITLRVLNNPRESGLQPPTRLLEYQPRLSYVCDLTVPAQTLTQAVEPLQLAHDMPHLLVLDAPGQAGAILQSDTLALQSFTWLALRVGSQSLYEEDIPGDEVCDLLQRAGFELVADDLDVLPPHREMLWRRSLLKVQVLQLQRQHGAAVADLAEARAELLLEKAQVVQVSDAMAQAKAEADKTANERQAHIDALARDKAQLSQARDAQTKLAAERQAQLESLTRDKAAAEKAAAERVAQIEQLNQAKAAVDKTAADRAAQVQQLTQARDEQAKLAGEQTELAAERQAQLESLKASSDALQSQLASARAETAAARTDATAAQANVTRVEQGSRSRIAELEDEIAQLRLRQRLLEEEMIKAEGQIELIKDVLLREPSL